MNTLLVVLALSLIPNAPDKLRVTAVPPAASDPDRPATWRFTIENVSGKELPSAPVWFSFSSATIVGIEPDHLQC